jgi:hypothetical protein
MPEMERNRDSVGGSLSQPFYSKRHIPWSIFVVLLLGIFVSRGAMLACVVPPLEMWDEYQHLAYIDCVVRTGRSPLPGINRVDADLLRRTLRLPASPPEWAQLSRFGAVTYSQYWNGDSGRATMPPFSRTLEIYEAQHPPVYYWLVSPVYRRLGDDLPLAISVLRLLNVGFVAVGVGAILIWLGKVCSDQRQAALLGLCVVLQPLFLSNADRVANDGLAVMLGSFAIVWAMSLPLQWIRIQSLGLGLLIGLGVMTKATDLILVPFAVVCVLMLAVRKQGGIGWRAAMQCCALLCAGSGIITGHYMLQSLREYGTITPMQEAVMNHAAHVHLNNYLRYAPISITKIRDWRVMMQHWIIGDGLWVGGWTGLQPPRWLTTVYEIFIVLSALAWIISRIFQQRRCPTNDPFKQPLVGTKILVLCLLMLLAMSYHSIESMVAWQGSSATTPWYASLVVPWFLIGIFSGPFTFSSRRAVRFAAVVPLLAALLFLGTEIDGTFFEMVPRYSCLPLSTAAFARLATLHPVWLDGTTLTIATAAESSLVTLALLIILSTFPLLIPAAVDESK